MSARSSNSAAVLAPAGPTGPVRTCVGCRMRNRSVDLLRIVAVDGALRPDPRHRLPGRGAWLHPNLGCLDAAERRRAFGRALRLSGQPDGTEVRALLTSPEPESRSTPK